MTVPPARRLGDSAPLHVVQRLDCSTTSDSDHPPPTSSGSQRTLSATPPQTSQASSASASTDASCVRARRTARHEARLGVLQRQGERVVAGNSVVASRRFSELLRPSTVARACGTARSNMALEEVMRFGLLLHHRDHVGELSLADTEIDLAGIDPPLPARPALSMSPRRRPAA